MIRRIIPLTLFIFIATFAIAQAPKTIKIETANNPNLVVACPPGANPDAGTSSQTLFPNAQSNDVLFLCLGDSLDIQHFGGDLSGDPQPISAPGFSYVFYTCAPTNAGPTSNDILNDPCHLVITPGMVTAVQSGVDIDGNATFFNQGQIQNVLNGGSPMTVTYAPVTLDDFAAFGFDPDPNTGESGPCINVNTSDAFTVTYLNAIDGTNINTSVNGNCTGSFTVTGGLPELDASTYTNVSITLSTDPSVEADIDGANFTHNDVIEFTVPQSGTYNVVIEDDKSCAANFTIDMGSCQDVVFIGGDEFANPASTICVPITVNNFTDVSSFQYTISWDPAVLQLASNGPPDVNTSGALADMQFGLPPVPGNALTVSWFDATFIGESLANGTEIFELCFDVIGAAGSSSPITFSGDLTQIEVLGPDPNNGTNLQPLGFNGSNGSVTVAGNIVLTFTSCSSLSGFADVGTFTVNAAGGIPPYSFTWVNTMDASIFGSDGIFTSGGSATIGDNSPAGDIPLPPGTYEITLTDNNGDMQIANVEIFDVAPLGVSINGVDPTCANTPDGMMELDNLPLDGVAPHTIVWSTMDMNVNSITGLLPGVYSVTVTDAAGCSRIDQDQLNASAIIIDTVSLQHVTCNGPGNDGAIIVSASGGVINPGSDYDYAWDNAAVGPNAGNLIPGTYCVSVTDDNNCQVVQCIDINAPSPPVVVSWDSVTVSCPTDMDGSLTVNADEGNSAIDSYTWDPAQPGADETITGLGPGTYYVTITAVDGCFVVDSATLFAPTPLVVDSTAFVIPNCPGDNNGSATVFVSGGTFPYTYTWSTGAVGMNQSVLPALFGDSTYTVTITDSGSCGDEVVASITVDNPTPIDVQFVNPTPVSCNDGIPCDGTAIAIASGGTVGTGLYDYNWPSGEMESDVIQSMAMQLCQGPNIIEVNDGVCSVLDTVIIGAPDTLELDLVATDITPASCFGAIDGAVTAIAEGGTPGYTFQWTNPNVNGPTITDQAAGNYSGILTDANGCTHQYNVEIPEPMPLIPAIANSEDVNCNGSANGSIEVSWSGGNAGNATYAWTDNVSTTSVGNNLAVGIYTITVTDEMGCNGIVSDTLNEPPPIVFVLDTIVPPACFGFQTFISLDTVYGGTGGNNAPFSFQVESGPITQALNGSVPVLAGTYTISIFDATPNFGCSTDTTITINQPLPVQVDLGDDIEIELGDSIEIDAIINAPAGADSIVWSPLTALTCIDSACTEVSVMPLETIAYNLMVTDANGCVGTDDILVEVDKNRNVYIPNIFTPDGDGFNDIFQVYTGAGVENISFMKVFDRWGEQVYEGIDILPGDNTTDGWNGFFKGKVMNPAVFVYIIEVEFTDGIVLLYRGDVTLMH